MLELDIRRNNFFRLMKENSAAIFFSGVSKNASEDSSLPFCVNKNFFYLTNINQEHSALLLVKGVSEKHVYLFVDEPNPVKEKWFGRKLSFDEVSSLSSIYNVYGYGNLENMISLALAKENNDYGNIQYLYVDQAPEQNIDKEVTAKVFTSSINEKYPHITVLDSYEYLRDLRMIKSSLEVENIVKAINMTNSGLSMIISNLRPGVKEHILADKFEMYGREHDRSKLAFDTIVASGKNATILHYPQQNGVVKQGDLVLFDLGFRNNEYCADISRTYPVDGKFTGVGKTIYEIVLGCNKAVIEYISAGQTIKDVQDYTIKYLTEECKRAGLIKTDEDIRKVYYHNISHHLGLDTHDISIRERPLENGNVITVEPGLYFEEYGVGVRIEDDVLIRDGKAEVLSKAIKKEIDDIEKLFKTRGL